MSPLSWLLRNALGWSLTFLSTFKWGRNAKRAELNQISLFVLKPNIEEKKNPPIILPWRVKNALKQEETWAQAMWVVQQKVWDDEGENIKWVLKKWMRGHQYSLREASHLPPACPGHLLPYAWHDASREMKTSYWHPASVSPSNTPSCLTPSVSHFLFLSLPHTLSLPHSRSCFLLCLSFFFFDRSLFCC